MRWIVRGLTVIAGLVVLLLVVLYGGSEWIIRQSHAVPTPAVAVPTDAASIAEGGRLARVASCRECHGANGEGKVLIDDPMFGRVAPPSLARAAAAMNDGELARAIRHGVHKDGSTLYIMPAHALGRLSDEDLGRIIAWMRTLKPGPRDTQATTSFGPIGRALILTGKLRGAATAATLGPQKRPAEMGPYLVGFTCLGCHKLHEPTMMEDGKTPVPALAPMAASYEPARFRRLLRTGVGSKPDHGLMSVVAREGFRYMSDDEIAAVQAYLKAEVEKAPAR